MLWGCSSSAGTLIMIDGIKTSCKYHAIFAQNLLASVRKLNMKSNYALQNNSNPKHTSTKKDQNLGMVL